MAHNVTGNKCLYDFTLLIFLCISMDKYRNINFILFNQICHNAHDYLYNNCFDVFCFFFLIHLALIS